MSAFARVAPDAGGTPQRNWRAFGILIGMVTLPLIAIDQLSKLYVSSHMMLYESIPVITNWVDITYTQNPGAAFSMFATFPPIVRTGMLFALSSAAIVVLIVLLFETDRITPLSFAFALILAGASGNLIDRAVRGQVIDFVRVHYFDLSYPIFNVADSAISIGVVLIILATFLSPSESK